jgi:guanine deaminase
MQQAIAKTRKGIAAGQFPYGAAIVRDGQLIVCEHNVVNRTGDPTMHAEVHAIRAACLKLKTVDLSGCEIYCTCEPCAMCMGACYFSNIARIYFGAGIEDKFSFGLPDLGVGASAISRQSKTAPKVTGGFCREQCVELFRQYLKRANSAAPTEGSRPAGRSSAPRRRAPGKSADPLRSSASRR